MGMNMSNDHTFSEHSNAAIFIQVSRVDSVNFQFKWGKTSDDSFQSTVL